ncbi:hypothetical protein ACKFKG_21905 [Phormidesmis sp. 146-35]
MNTSVKPRKTEPHHRLTVKDVIRDYKAGLLTTRGAIFYLVAAARKIGEIVKVSVSWICKQLGINPSTYYRAIGALSEQSRLKINAPDEMEMSIPISTTEGVPDYIFLEKLSHFCNNPLQDCNTELQDRESELHDCNSQLQKCDKKTPEPSHSNRSETPQSLHSLQSFSIEEKREREPKKSEESLIPEEEQENFLEWLDRKADQLPSPPALREQWLKSQSRVKENQIDFLKEKSLQEKTKRSAAPPNWDQIEFACDASIAKSDYVWALKRLQTLRDDGYKAEVDELLGYHPDWNLAIAYGCVVRAES